MIELELSEYVLDSFNYLSTLIDLSQVMKLKMLFSDCEEFVLKIQEKLFNLFKETNKFTHSKYSLSTDMLTILY